MKLRLNIDGKNYEVEVEVLDENVARGGAARPAAQSAQADSVALYAPVATPPQPDATVTVDESKSLRSPISGVVVRVPAEVGQTVKTNDTLLVVEAMKMETVITSQCDGKIARINAKEGDAVQVKQVLVEFE